MQKERKAFSEECLMMKLNLNGTKSNIFLNTMGQEEQCENAYLD
jgi:hypothetical protein